MDKNYLIEEIEIKNELYKIYHYTNIEYSSVKPKNLRVVINSKNNKNENFFGVNYENIEFMDELKNQLQKKGNSWQHDQGVILAYAVKTNKVNNINIYRVIEDYNGEADKEKEYMENNQGILSSKFINREDNDVSDIVYCNWLTYCHNINSVFERLTLDKSNEWEIIAWDKGLKILTVEDYEKEILPVKNWLSGNCYKAVRESDGKAIVITDLALKEGKADIKQEIKDYMIKFTPPPVKQKAEKAGKEI